ncbi:MAG TPA: condensation domain-containing protein, partial [Candidatus Deferrimicrobium sp.]|nr:condensation domain-containing protein [Candidatus Deferrimicrobium sp.]
MVILNSVIQYFPSAGYLVDVLEKAAAKIKPGGHIFIGDVRSLPLLKTFHASVEIARAEPGVDKETILRRVLNKIAMEQELVIDSMFFEALKNRIPRIKHVERLIKYGRYTNELSKFRYDIILHIEEENMELSTLKPELVIDWQLEKPGIADIENVLLSLANQGTAPGCILMTSIPNARVARDIDALKQLSGMDEPATAHGFDPNDFLQFADGYPYDISVLVPALPGAEGTFDAVFIHRDLKTKNPGAVVVNSHLSLSPGETSDWNSYTNNPLLVKIAGRLVPQWRDFLKERIPEYMIPSHFVVLDRLPVTANGKLDRRMLPEPVQVNQTGGFTAPATATEIFLAELWKEILNLEQVSTNHNFFELGGDSVNAIQVVSRANKKGVEMNVQLLFRNQTIAGLAGAIEKNRPKILKAGEDTYYEFMKTLDMDAILKQLPPGVEIEDIYPASPLQLHQVHFLETQVIEDPPVYLYQKRNLPMNIRLDRAELEKIVQMVSERYQVLRTVIIWKNLKEPVQVVCKKMKFDLSYHDLTSIAAAEKNQAVNDLLKQDWNSTFDRQNSSPMRVGVFKLDENLYQYYFTGDYLRMEGWSASRFNHEILSYYQILKAGENIPNTAPQPNCYKEYVHTTRLLRKQEENPARPYWQTLFKDFSGMKSLTTLPGNQKGQGVGFGISYFYLSAALSARLEQFLMQNHLSLSPLIQGTWSALLGTYFQQDRVVYGMMTTGRAIPMAGIEHMTGHSINILPVVVPVTKKRTLLEYTRDIRDIQTEWTRYEYTQLEQIAGWLDCPGDGRLFDHYIVIQNLRSALGEIRGMARDNAGWLKNAHLVFAKMEYPLRIDIFPDYEYCFIFQYYPRFLTTAAVKGIMANFKTLIEAMLDNPHQTVAEWMKCVAVDKYKLFENEGPDSFVQE